MARTKARAGTDAISIPTKPPPPTKDLNEHNYTIFGAKGIGKSTIAAEAPDSLLFAWEPARKNLRLPKIPDHKETPLTWSRFKTYVQLLAKDYDPCRVIVDTIDLCADACDRHHAAEHSRRNNIAPTLKTIMGLKDYGASWRSLKDDFYETFQRLTDRGFTLTFVSHDRYRPLPDRGKALDEADDAPAIAQPTCSGWALDFLSVFSDFAFYYRYDGLDRVIVTNGGDDEWARNGCMENHFTQPKGLPNAGKPYNFILAGSGGPKEAYANLSSAFNNLVEGFFYETE